eukprot:COSAG03_NODE_12987_length_522_cov_3.222222_1_plen_160_part_10
MRASRVSPADEAPRIRIGTTCTAQARAIAGRLDAGGRAQARIRRRRKVLNAVAALCSSLQLAVKLEAQCCGCAEMLSDAETGAALEAMRLNAQRPEPRYLLLGATGNVGKHCLERLLADAAESGDAVRLIVATRDPERFWSGYRHPRRCPGSLSLSLSLS